MKILYIANVRIPTEKAHGHQIIKMAEAFISLGVDLKLIIPSRVSQEFAGRDPFVYYGVKNNFGIKKLKIPDPYWLMKLPSGIYIKIQSLFFIAGLFFYFLFEADKKQAFFYTRDYYLLPLLQLFSKKVVWECHDLPQNKKHYFRCWRRCFKIITITQGLKKELMKLGLPLDKILVASDAVDLAEFSLVTEAKEELRKKTDLPPDKKLIIYAGHLYNWKGAQTLAEASQFLSAEELIVFVGGTEKDVKNFKMKNKNFKNILVLGRRPHYEMPLYLKSADILVLPNSAKSDISKFYTSPLKLFEYMASGQPIIASHLDSLKEILTGSECVFFTPDDANDLAQKIHYLLSNKDLADKIAINAEKKVKDYTWENRAKNIIEFIYAKTEINKTNLLTLTF